MPEYQPLETGATDPTSVKVETPRGKWTYDWDAIGKAIKDGQAYVLPLDAKRNSIETGLKRVGINGKIAFHPNEKAYTEGKGQLVVIPK